MRYQVEQFSKPDKNGVDDISVWEKMCVFINSLYKWYNMNLCMYKCCVYTNLDIQIDLYTYISTDTYG